MMTSLYWLLDTWRHLCEKLVFQYFGPFLLFVEKGCTMRIPIFNLENDIQCYEFQQQQRYPFTTNSRMVGRPQV